MSPLLALVLAQGETGVPGGLSDAIATYGPFAPFAALLLWLLNLLWKDNKEKEKEIRRLTETAMERVIPLVLDATKVLTEAIEALREVRGRQQETQRLTILISDLMNVMEDLQQVMEIRTRRKEAK